MTGYGGMLSFELNEGRRRGTVWSNPPDWPLLAVSLGSVETLIEHPASMSHSFLFNDEELSRAGIPPD